MGYANGNFKIQMKKTSCLAACVILGLFVWPYTQALCAADNFSVTLLGTGCPVPIPDRFGYSTLIEAGGQRLVFDIGRGVTIRLWQKHIPLGSIDAHFLTHLHSDHINGLSDLWLSGWIQTEFGGRKKPFIIYGPKGTEKMMANLWEAFSEDRRIRIADEKNPLSGIAIDAHDVNPGIVYEKNGVVVTALEVDHGELVKPCYGYKITYRNHIVVLSGDTRYNLNVVKAARGADLLVHEVAMIPDKLFAQFPVFRAIYEHHITPELAGKLFAATQPKLAVYSHIVLPGLPKEGIPFPTPEELLTATRKTYDGPLMVGADLMTFKIDDKGVSLVKPSSPLPVAESLE
jgi:ribonuclease Z